jgi:hypothetical protein
MTMQAILINPNQLAPKVDAAMRKLKRSKDVAHVRYDFGNDWSGDPAVYFRIVLSDEAAGEGKRRKVARRIEENLIEELGFYSVWPIIPYFSYRSASEHAELHDPKWI